MSLSGYKADFAGLEWSSPMEGVRHKCIDQADLESAFASSGVDLGDAHRDVQVGRLRHVEPGDNRIGLDEWTTAHRAAPVMPRLAPFASNPMFWSATCHPTGLPSPPESNQSCTSTP